MDGVKLPVLVRKEEGGRVCDVREDSGGVDVDVDVDVDVNCTVGRISGDKEEKRREEGKGKREKERKKEKTGKRVFATDCQIIKNRKNRKKMGFVTPTVDPPRTE